ncbi:MAG: hypothetical protein U5N58_14830 [Actinomycetota bacterium]|nr:hypothetical protein [Actinomycetota bacterium]
MQDANKAVYRLSVSDAGYAGMGTTLTACYLKENIAHVCHVGDSRLYFKRGKELFLKTHDHTLVGELYREGKIDAEQAFNHPKKIYYPRLWVWKVICSPKTFS